MLGEDQWCRRRCVLCLCCRSFLFFSPYLALHFHPLATYFHGRIKRETIHSQCSALLFHTRFLFSSRSGEMTCVVMTHLCRPSRVLHAERSEGIYTVRHSAEFRKRYNETRDLDVARHTDAVTDAAKHCHDCVAVESWRQRSVDLHEMSPWVAPRRSLISRQTYSTTPHCPWTAVDSTGPKKTLFQRSKKCFP